MALLNVSQSDNMWIRSDEDRTYNTSWVPLSTYATYTPVSWGSPLTYVTEPVSTLDDWKRSIQAQPFTTYIHDISEIQPYEARYKGNDFVLTFADENNLAFRWMGEAHDDEEKPVDTDAMDKMLEDM